MIDIIRHQNKVKSPIDSNLFHDVKLTSTEVIRPSSITTELFDDIKADQSDETDNERFEINNNNDTFHHIKSNSSDNLAHRSSIQEISNRYDQHISLRKAIFV